MEQGQRTEFGRRVRRAREDRGLTQEQLAAAAGVSANTVLSIETGKRSPQPQSITRVMEALDLEPAPEEPDLPADVAMVSRLVALWMLRIPEGAARDAAVLDLVQFLRTPVADDAPVLDRTPGRGRGKASDMRTAPAQR